MRTAILFLSLLLVGCGLLTDRSNINYITKITRISLPDDVRIISEYDNGEFMMVGKYQLPKKEIERFIVGKPFKHIDQFFTIVSRIFRIVGKEYRIPLDDSTHLSYFTGCKPGNDWSFIINDSTGELWVKVGYPDWGGLGPGCDTTKK